MSEQSLTINLSNVYVRNLQTVALGTAATSSSIYLLFLPHTTDMKNANVAPWVSITNFTASVRTQTSRPQRTPFCAQTHEHI